MNKKKVDVLFDFFYPSVGGVQTILKETYSRMAKDGWEINLHVMNIGQSHEKLKVGTEKLFGINVRRYNKFVYKFLPFRINISTKEGLICFQDFITLPYYYFYFIILIRKLLGLKIATIILTSHGLFSAKLETYTGMELWTRRLKRILDRTIGVFLVNETVSKICAVSLSEKEALTKAGVESSKIEIINNGTSINNDSNYSKEIMEFTQTHSPYVTHIGRIDRVKNFEASINSLVKIDARIKLIIVGPVEDKQYKEELVTLVKELRLDERVIFTGTISRPDLDYLLKRAVANLLLSFNEGYPGVVLEAMSNGCINVISNEITREILIDGIQGYRVDLNNNDSVSEIINRIFLMGDGDSIKKMKASASDYAKMNSWENSCRKLEELYFRIIEEKIYV